jgi:glyoxylase-like metal-dependent hydrolase (beta-lactamase superfamily II)
VFAFLVRHPEGVVLYDTGVAEHPVIEQLYRPKRRMLADALEAAGIRSEEVRMIVNSHLHFDHCGANPMFPGTVILAQEAEHEAALQPHYTVRDCIEFPGATMTAVSGEVEVLPGVTIVPTPGHTPGHQSLVVESDCGLAVLAGQAVYKLEEYRHAEEDHSVGLDSSWDRDQYAASLRRLRDLDPDIVYFSHDTDVWRKQE